MPAAVPLVGLAAELPKPPLAPVKGKLGASRFFSEEDEAPNPPGMAAAGANPLVGPVFEVDAGAVLESEGVVDGAEAVAFEANDCFFAVASESVLLGSFACDPKEKGAGAGVEALVSFAPAVEVFPKANPPVV